VKARETKFGHAENSASPLEQLCLQLLGLRPVQNSLGMNYSSSTGRRFAEIIHTGSIRERKRAELILLLESGQTGKESARILTTCRTSAKKYAEAFQKEGFDSILNPSRKLKRADNDDIRGAVFRVLHSPPQAHGFVRTTWKMKDINDVLRRQGTPISEEVIRKIIRRSGYRWKKARKVLTSRDPEYTAKLDRIQEILSGLREDEKFFSIDEFGPVVIKLHGGKRLVPPGECPTVPHIKRIGVG
jgi:transposase